MINLDEQTEAVNRIIKERNRRWEMNLPCIDCEYRTERTQGHRTFVGCKDKDRKEKHFIEDIYWYRHKCTGYVKDKTNKKEK